MWRARELEIHHIQKRSNLGSDVFPQSNHFMLWMSPQAAQPRLAMKHRKAIGRTNRTDRRCEELSTPNSRPHIRFTKLDLANPSYTSCLGENETRLPGSLGPAAIPFGNRVGGNAENLYFGEHLASRKLK